MTKNTFLEELKSNLLTELGRIETQQHIDYYRDYIESEIRSGKTEEEVLESLGSPRLIAKTIIESAKSDRDIYIYESEENTGRKEEKASRSRVFNFALSGWILNLILFMIFLVFIVAVGGLVGIFLIKFLFPILLIVFLISIFSRKR